MDALSICPPFLLQGEASVRWAQDANQGISGRAAWGDARTTLYHGLTLPAKAERDGALARTFQILGQQMHLIADLAVPAHTRNDPHCPFPEGLEAWASDRDNQSLIAGLLASDPVRPDTAIFNIGVPIQDAVATVPVARLWDTDQYDGTNPGATGSLTIGLAEYTNANFFSDDTILSSEIPFPAVTSVALRSSAEEAPGTGGQLRRYFQKVGDGELVEHVAVPGALYDFLPDALKDKNIGLDAKVFADYAEKLLPRAVGYSAALLDYFFRGRLEVQVEPVFDAGTFRPALRIVNRTPGETMTGRFELFYDALDGTRRTLAVWSDLTLPPDAPSDLLLLPTVGSASGPADLLEYVLVFRGQLGDEPDAVAGAPLRLSFFVLFQAGEADGVPVADGSLAIPFSVSSLSQTGLSASHGRHVNFTSPGSAEGQSMIALYRNLEMVPGNVAVVTADPDSRCVVGIIQRSPPGSSSAESGATADLVAFAEPSSVEELSQYKWPGPPATVLASLTDSSGAVRVTLGDVRFIGLKLTSPLLPGGGDGYESFCDFGVTIDFLSE